MGTLTPRGPLPRTQLYINTESSATQPQPSFTVMTKMDGSTTTTTSLERNWECMESLAIDCSPRALSPARTPRPPSTEGYLLPLLTGLLGGWSAAPGYTRLHPNCPVWSAAARYELGGKSHGTIRTINFRLALPKSHLLCCLGWWIFSGMMY